MRFDLDPYHPERKGYFRWFVWGRDLRFDRDGWHPMYWILRLPRRWRLTYRMSGMDNQRFGRLYLYRRPMTDFEALLAKWRER